MSTIDILTAACIITLLSLILKFIKLKKENISIFSDIKRKGIEIMEQIAKQRISVEIESASIKRFHLAISDWFSAIAIIIVTYLLLYDYLNIEPLTKASMFKIGLLFMLLLFNIIFLAVSIIERRLGYWIDEFTNINRNILEIIQIGRAKKPLKKTRISASYSKTRKRRG